MSPKVVAPDVYANFKTLNLHEIILAYQRNFTPSGSCEIPTPPQNLPMSKVIITQATRLLPPVLLQYFGCGDGMRLALLPQDYGVLVNQFGIKTLNFHGGDLILPEEGYEILKGIIQRYLNQVAQQHQQQQQFRARQQQSARSEIAGF